MHIEAHVAGACRFGSTAAWLAGMAYLKCWLNCRFLVGVIIQAYMHGREGWDFLSRALPSFPLRLSFLLPHLLRRAAGFNGQAHLLPGKFQIRWKCRTLSCRPFQRKDKTCVSRLFCVFVCLMTPLNVNHECLSYIKSFLLQVSHHSGLFVVPIPQWPTYTPQYTSVSKQGMLACSCKSAAWWFLHHTPGHHVTDNNRTKGSKGICATWF